MDVLYALAIGGFVIYGVGYAARMLQRSIKPALMTVGLMVIVGTVVMNWLSQI